jgi:hypothetical protein
VDTDRTLMMREALRASLVDAREELEAALLVMDGDAHAGTESVTELVVAALAEVGDAYELAAALDASGSVPSRAVRL